VYRVLLGNMKERDLLKDQGIDGRMLGGGGGWLKLGPGGAPL
jgi:hypothetical protein